MREGAYMWGVSRRPHEIAAMVTPTFSSYLSGHSYRTQKNHDSWLKSTIRDKESRFVTKCRDSWHLSIDVPRFQIQKHVFSFVTSRDVIFSLLFSQLCNVTIRDNIVPFVNWCYVTFSKTKSPFVTNRNTIFSIKKYDHKSICHDSWHIPRLVVFCLELWHPFDRNAIVLGTPLIPRTWAKHQEQALAFCTQVFLPPSTCSASNSHLP